MRLKTLRASNYMTIRAAVIEVPADANAIVIAGPNGAGKTALVDAIRLILTGTLPRALGYKKDLPNLITEGEKDGWVGATIIGGDGRTAVEYKTGLKTGVASAPPPLAAQAALSVSPQQFMRLDAKERRNALYSLFGVSLKGSDIVATLVKDGHSEDRVRKLSTSFGAGFAAAAKRAKELASEARGAWQATTGENYGAQKAAGWAAPVRDYGEVGDPRALASQLADKRAEAQVAHRNLLQAQQDERAHASAEFMRMQAANLGKAESLLAAHDEKLEAARSELAANKATAAAAAGWSAPCPSCGTHLMVGAPGELTLYEGRAPTARAAAIAQNAQNKLADLTSERPKLARAVDDARAAKLALERLPPRPEADELERLAAVDRELREEVDVLERSVEAAKAAQTAELDAAKATEAATRYHDDVAAYTALSEAVDALPARYLAETLGKVNEALDAVSHSFGERVTLGDDMQLRYGMTAYPFLSESQQWRADLALGLALAPQSSGIVLMDRFDMVQPQDRGAILQMLGAQTRAQVFIAATLKEAPRFPEGAGLFVHWLGG